MITDTSFGNILVTWCNRLQNGLPEAISSTWMYS